MKKVIFLTIFALLTLASCSNSSHWSSVAEQTMNLDEAVSYCSNLNESGHNDWRLPNIDELRTLIQNHSGTVTGGTCPVSEKTGKLASTDKTNDCNRRSGNNFCKLESVSGFFWSSSRQSDHPDTGWVVDFSGGGVVRSNTMIHGYVRCVR